MKKLICIVVSVIFLIALSGCSSFDPVQYVDAYLHHVVTGEVTDELMESTGETKEELDKEYQEVYEKLIDGFFDEVNLDAYTEDVGGETVKEFVDAYLSSIKYEVSDEYTEQDDIYYVNVKVWPIKCTESMDSYASGDFMDEWKNKVMSGEYKYTTESQLQIDVLNDLFNKLAEKIKNAEYGDPETVEMRVEFDGDYYTINDDDLETLFSKTITNF